MLQVRYRLRLGIILLAGLSALPISCRKQPNVILIMVDDMGVECLSMYGGTSYQTPNLEQMANNGMVVSHCISQPLCTPSRVKLMTGLYNSRNYTHFGRLDTSWFNIGTLMKEAGYKTCISGKWQLNGLSYPDQFPDWNDPARPNLMGFDEYCLWQLTHTRSEGERYANPLIEQNGKLLETGLSDYGPDLFSDFILEFIDRNSDVPFFAYYPMVLVHEPFVPTPDSKDWQDPGARYRKDTTYFRDMVSYADKIVGRIHQKLAEKGISDRTIVIFTADNGTDRSIVSQTRGRMVNGAKGMTIQDGVHVPLLISWPDQIKKGKEFRGLVEFSDFFATLADLVNRPVITDGKSFLPLLMGNRYETRRSARVHYDPRWGEWVNQHRNSFIQNMDYKLYQDRSLYSLRDDFLEEHPMDLNKLNTNQDKNYTELSNEFFPVPDIPPNLLLIITDDQGYGDLSLHGNPILETPNLDAIGLKGVRLDNFHVSPVCAPTRAALMTGRRPMSTGAYYVTRGGEVMNAAEYTMAEVLKDNGYSTGYIGKWHNGSHHPHHPLSQGFDQFFGFTAGHVNRYFDPELEENGKLVKTEGYIADIFTDRAISYMKEQKNVPFFCCLAYNTPHSPFQVPDTYFDIYKNRVIEQDTALQIMNASVYGMVKNIDDNVGRLMQTLEELELEENTIVVFLTDNGPNTHRFNGFLKGRKGWVNDGGVRVPCFIRWDGHIPENKVIHSVTAHIDLLPTLVTLMGAEFIPRKEVHGQDLTGRILGVDREADRFLFTHVNQGTTVTDTPGAVRTADWRLTFTLNNRPELTARTDTREIKNLADSLPLLSDSLKLAYDAWFRSLGSLQIPAIPLGYSDSVVIPANEGFLTGNARYYWSDNGWSNDWVTRLDVDSSTICWPLNAYEPGYYRCEVRYTSPVSDAAIMLDFSGSTLERELPVFIPVRDHNYSRIDRAAEAIGQTWGRITIGDIQLGEGNHRLVLQSTGTEVEVLEVILHRL